MQTTTPTAQPPWSVRPRFAPRQLLTAKQLNQGLKDELSRQRLLNRALHGHGVVFGYGLTSDESGNLDVEGGCTELTCGLALDRHGRMLYWPGGRIGMHHMVGKQPDCGGSYTLLAHYAEREDPPDGCLPWASDRARWSEHAVVFSLRLDHEPWPRDCPDHPEGECISHDQYLGQRTGATPGDRTDTIAPSPDLEWACQEPGPLCRTDCGTWLYDPEASIPIARVEICDLANKPDPRSYEESAEQTGSSTDPPPRTDPPCEPDYGFCLNEPAETTAVRPYVYRSPLLYELTKCCDVDLARVSDTSWTAWTDDWATEVPWYDFQARMGRNGDGLTVYFSKPIRVTTLHQASIFLTAIYQENRTDYWMPQRVPVAVEPVQLVGDDFASAARLIPDEEWSDAEVEGRRSTLNEGAQFELTVRGQVLRDECGQMLDARPLGDFGDRCQHRPGGDFISVFKVGPAHV